MVEIVHAHVLNLNMRKRIRVCLECKAQVEEYSVYHGNKKVIDNTTKSLHEEIVGESPCNILKCDALVLR